MGVVEVCFTGGWKRVCDNEEGWTQNDSVVTCRQLGYPNPNSAESLGSHSQGWDTPSNTTVPSCHGYEATLSSCPTSPSPSNCAWLGVLVDCSRCTAIPTLTSTPKTNIAPTSSSILAPNSQPAKRPAPTTTPPSLRSSRHQSTASSHTKATMDHSKATVLRTDATATPSYDLPTSEGLTQATESAYSLNSVTVQIIGGVTIGLVSLGLISCLVIITCSACRKLGRGKKYEMEQNVAYLEQKKMEKQRQQQPSESGSIQEPIYEHIE